jgi:alanine racemase
VSVPRATTAGYVEVDLGALVRNFDRLTRAAAGAEVAAVVKANAYGLGVAPVATRLSARGCTSFFVATFEEGCALRTVLPEAAIYVFEGVAAGRERSFVEQRLRPVLNAPEQATRWLGSGQPCAVHIDTGMNRLGMGMEESRHLAESLSEAAQRSIALVMTHLACADEPDVAMNRAQVERFAAIAQRFPRARTSFANSASVFLDTAYRGDVVRAGIALYGGNPFTERESPTEVVASLKARVLQLRDVESDSTVGYGATHRAAQGDRLAVIGVGYADGFPRRLGGRGVASVAGRRVPIVGRISMDLTCLDVSALPRDAIALDQYVELFGREIPVEEVAALCGTINYEILSGLGMRLARMHVG